MARIVSELIYKLIADETELVKGLQKAEKDTDALAKKFTESGKKLTLGLTVPIVAAGAAMIKLASETEDSINAVNVVFKEGADAVLSYGDIASETAGLSKNAFNDVANSFGVLLSMTTDNMDVVADNTITLTQRAADLASLLGGTTKEAAVALGAALRGETEPARRYGIILSEATVQAKALELGIGDVSGELTEAEKVQVRYNLILEQSARAQGDFANTNEATKNSAQVLKAQISNLTAELGEQLLPIVVEVLGGLRNLMSQFSELSDEEKRAILVVAGVAAAIGPMLIGIGQTIRAVNTLRTAFVALGVAGGGPLTLAIAGIAAFSAALFGAYSKLKDMNDTFEETKKIMAGGTTGNQAKDLELLNKQIRNVTAALESQKEVGFGVDELQKQLDALIKSKNELIKMSQWREKTKTDLAAQLPLQERSTALDVKKQESLKKVSELTTSVLEGNRTEAGAIQSQIDLLNNSPVLKGQNEKDRLAALEILRAKQLEVLEAERVEQQTRAEENTNDLISRKEQYFQALQEMSTAELNAYALTTNAANVASINKILAQRAIDEEDAKNKAAQRKREEDLQAIQAIGIKSLLSGFADIGAELQKGDLEWSDWGRVGLRAISAVLRALGETMAAQAAVSLGLGFFKPSAWAAIGPLLAGSAAAFTASGVVESLAGGLQEGGQFTVPAGFNGDTFPLPAAMLSSGERVTVETPEQQSSNRGITLQVGVLVADEAGLRELDRRLRDVGSFETARRG